LPRRLFVVAGAGEVPGLLSGVFLLRSHTGELRFVQNWTTEAASVLAGVSVSELQILLNAGASPAFDEDIDNVVLTPAAAAVPEPASLTLLAVGLAGLGMVVRLRRT
jgi:hypothetical protein